MYRANHVYLLLASLINVLALLGVAAQVPAAGRRAAAN
jgi:hypothetical protein